MAKVGRKENGQGTVRRLSNGKIQCSIETQDEFGKRKIITATADKETEARKKAQSKLKQYKALLMNGKKGEKELPTKTLKEVIGGKWFDDYAKNRWTSRTKKARENDLKILYDSLGSMRLDKITTIIMNNFFNNVLTPTNRQRLGMVCSRDVEIAGDENITVIVPTKNILQKEEIALSEREHKTKISEQEGTDKQANDTQDSQSPKALKKHSEKLNFFASISTIVSSLVAILTLGVTLCTLNTITSINNTINTTINNSQIIQSDGLNITQYGDNSSITISIDNALRYETIDSKFGTEEEARLLSLAKRYFDAGDYQMAFSIYSSEELKENDYATINRAYCYAHGYGTISDTEIAMSLYDSVCSDDSRRNKLALMITSNNNGVYNSEILEEFNYFSSIKDYNVLNYLSLCKYGKPIDLISEKSFEIELSDIYCYELVEDKLYATGQSAFSTPYEKLMYVGAVTRPSSNGMQGIYYRYQLYRLPHLDWLERLFG